MAARRVVVSGRGTGADTTKGRVLTGAALPVWWAATTEKVRQPFEYQSNLYFVYARLPQKLPPHAPCDPT